MRRFLVSSLALYGLTLTSMLAGCGAEPTVQRTCSTGSDCRANESCIDGVCKARAAVPDAGARDTGTPPRVDGGPPPNRELMAIRLEPATAMLVSTDGSTPTQQFTVIARFVDGTEGSARGPAFVTDAPQLGAIDAAGGLFTASGVLGGTATITATVMGPTGPLTATATVDVRVARTFRGPGVPADAESKFSAVAAGMAGQRADVVYPLAGTVMPQNVYPADIQWLNGQAGDLFRVTLTKPHLTAVAYVLHGGATFNNDWLVDESIWRSFAQTDGDAPGSITVDRWVAATQVAFSNPAIPITFARTALTGSVYYWNIGRGRIVRIDDGTVNRVEFMNSPPIDTNTDPQYQSRCVGCHTISPSGRYMAGRLGGGDNIGGVFDLTRDLTVTDPPTVFPLIRGTAAQSSTRWWFSTWNPAETRMMVTQIRAAGYEQFLTLMDPFTGAVLPSTGTPLPALATHPSWAPDNSAIAYAANANNWGGGFTSADIGVIPVTGSDAFGPQAVLHVGASLAGSPEGGMADSYPTWSPDSQLIAFAHGTGARSAEDRALVGGVDTITRAARGALYAMRPDGTGLIRLDAASGSENLNFQPRFAPFTGAGYVWLSFLSRRDYGNERAGTRNADHYRPNSATDRDRNTSGQDGEPDYLQQIWVSAIKVGAPAGTDPSAPPYWLPGQTTDSRNIAAFWAPRACRANSDSCSVGSECCSGDCRPPAGGGAPVCSPPPPSMCRNYNQTCSQSSDCCGGLECQQNVCVPPIN